MALQLNVNWGKLESCVFLFKLTYIQKRFINKVALKSTDRNSLKFYRTTREF